MKYQYNQTVLPLYQREALTETDRSAFKSIGCADWNRNNLRIWDEDGSFGALWDVS